MTQLDPIFTKKIQTWLETPATERNIMEGATMLLQLNRNRALYNSIVTRPAKFADKLEYELRKHLRIRLAGMAVADVVRLEAQVIPQVQKTISEQAVISTSDELPEAVKARGRRADHDSLPAEVQALWDDNVKRYRTIKYLFEELKNMADAEPCDRFEKLQLLSEADRKYRDNLNQYDDYIPGLGTPIVDDPAKAISAARKNLSKYKRIFLTAPSDSQKRVAALDKIQSTVNTLLSLNAKFTPESIAEMSAWGIKF